MCVACRRRICCVRCRRRCKKSSTVGPVIRRKLFCATMKCVNGLGAACMPTDATFASVTSARQADNMSARNAPLLSNRLAVASTPAMLSKAKSRKAVRMPKRRWACVNPTALQKGTGETKRKAESTMCFCISVGSSSRRVTYESNGHKKMLTAKIRVTNESRRALKATIRR